ncbi:unnamed protein product [Rotaria magnacalcarata]
MPYQNLLNKLEKIIPYYEKLLMFILILKSASSFYGTTYQLIAIYEIKQAENIFLNHNLSAFSINKLATSNDR